MTYRKLTSHHFKPMTCANESCRKTMRVPFATLPDGSIYCSRGCYENRK